VAHKLLLWIGKRERVQGKRYSAEGQALDPHPDLEFLKPNCGIRGCNCKYSKMKVIWQKYKVWLLIWLFYAAYYALKSLIKLKSIDVQTAKSGSSH